MNRKLRRRLLLLARIALSTLLLAYLLNNIQLSQVLPILKTASPYWLGLALVAIFVGKILISLRWQLLLASQGTSASLRRLITSVFVGDFWRVLLPTKLGGEISRAYDVAAQTDGSPATGVSSVVIDRTMGVLALASIAATTSILGRERIPHLEPWGWLIGGALVFALVVLALCFHETHASWFASILRIVGEDHMADKFMDLLAAFQVMGRDKAVLLKAFSLSLLLQVLVVFHHAFMVAALGLSIQLNSLFIIVPMALLVLMFPVSISGIGLREAAFVLLLGSIGVAPEEAIALSWLAFGVLLLQAAAGGLMLLVRTRRGSGMTEESVSAKLTPGVEGMGQ